MATTTSNQPKNGSGTAEDTFMDDLEDYDFPELDTSIREIEEIPKDPATGKDSLGIDDEVKVRKKRITVKLDADRLLSKNGIPKLRKEAPKLKFKGKGHEYQDASRLLSYYQLWADDLFKKAKFRDTLNIIEKLGHSRTIQYQRQSYIMESKKAKNSHAVGGEQEREQSRSRDIETPQGHTEGNPISNMAAASGAQTAGSSGPSAATTQDPDALFLGISDSDNDDDFGMPDDAELDALMNSTNIEEPRVPREGNPGPKEKDSGPRDEFEDEMEALMDAGMDF